VFEVPAETADYAETAENDDEIDSRSLAEAVAVSLKTKTPKKKTKN
jgi:hypothetical protein